MPSAARSRLSPSPSLPSAASPDFMTNLLNCSEIVHHNLATCNVFPLVEWIWKRYWSCRSVVRTLCRVVQSFRCAQLRLQPSTSMVLDLQRRSDIYNSLIFMKMHRIWLQSLEGESVQRWVHWVQVQISIEGHRFRNNGQIFINYRPGVFVPLLLSMLINDYLKFHLYCNFCCEIGCLFKHTGWDGLYQQIPVLALHCTKPLLSSLKVQRLEGCLRVLIIYV